MCSIIAWNNKIQLQSISCNNGGCIQLLKTKELLDKKRRLDSGQIIHEIMLPELKIQQVRANIVENSCSSNIIVGSYCPSANPEQGIYSLKRSQGVFLNNLTFRRHMYINPAINSFLKELLSSEIPKD